MQTGHPCRQDAFSEIFNGLKEFMIQCHIINPARLSKHIDNNKYFSVESCPHRPHKGGSSATIGHVAITWPRTYSENLVQNFPSGFKTDAFSLFNGKSMWKKNLSLQHQQSLPRRSGLKSNGSPLSDLFLVSF